MKLFGKSLDANAPRAHAQHEFVFGSRRSERQPVADHPFATGRPAEVRVDPAELDLRVDRVPI